MNKIFKLLFASLFIITLSSCDNEDMEQLTVSPKGSGEITAPESGFSYVLNPEETLTNTAFTLTWNPSDYDVPTEINYDVEFCLTGTEFETPFLAGSTTNTNLSWNIMEFNGAVISAGLLPFVENELDIRIVSTVGTLGTSIPQISEKITVFSAKCTHLGCKINNIENDQLICPCHGSVYRTDGSILKGPSRKPLTQLHYTINKEEGNLIIELS